MYDGPSRGGTRGGKDQFKFTDLRTMSHNDREQYLGFSTKIGFLDKGGKWRKSDWYTKKKEQQAGDLTQAEIELRKEQEADERRMQEALGIAPKKEEKLTKKELQELLYKIKNPQDNLTQQQREELDHLNTGERQQGLGYSIKAEELQQKANQKLKDGTISKIDLNYNKLEGENYMTSGSGNRLASDYDQPAPVTKVIKKQEESDNENSKDQKKKKKKDKKDKKQKKDKKSKKNKKKHKKEKKKKERHDTSSEDSD